MCCLLKVQNKILIFESPSVLLDLALHIPPCPSQVESVFMVDFIAIAVSVSDL